MNSVSLRSSHLVAIVAVTTGLCVACVAARSDTPAQQRSAVETAQLPTGVVLDPAGSTFDVGSMPLTLLPAPEPDRAVLVLSGWREQGIQVIRPSTGEVLQTVEA